jgi:predicted nuclease with TOPRIM domain
MMPVIPVDKANNAVYGLAVGAEVKLIDKIVDVLQDQISKLEERVKELEERVEELEINRFRKLL